MAFILPLMVVGSVSGFVAGYYYNAGSVGTYDLANQTVCNIDTNNITVQDLNVLKKNSPHKEIQHELVTFDKKKLKKTSLKDHIITLTDEQKMINNLRQKIINRRHLLNNRTVDCVRSL